MGTALNNVWTKAVNTWQTAEAAEASGCRSDTGPVSIAEAWTTVPRKKTNGREQRLDREALHPLPQRMGLRCKQVSIRAGGYEKSRNPASGPRWTQPRVERLASSSRDADKVDPELACYLWD